MFPNEVKNRVVLLNQRINQLNSLKQECAAEIKELQKICRHELRKVWIGTFGLFRVRCYRCLYCDAETATNGGDNFCEVCDGQLIYNSVRPHTSRYCICCKRPEDADYFGISKEKIPAGDIVEIASS